MPSPFPGMDPYIESSGLWGDFHGAMVIAMRDDLNALLPEEFVATLEVYDWAHDAKKEKLTRPVEPDVFVWEYDPRRSRSAGSVKTLTPPATSVLPSLIRHKRRVVVIQEVGSRQMVSAIELLSPTNKKPGPDRAQYLAKRDEYLANRVNLIEIDLLRKGQRPPLGEKAPEIADYYVMVCKSWEYPRIGIWPFTIRDSLPQIPVPIIPEIPDIPLDLRACIDRAYLGARYAKTLPYHKQLAPRPRKQDLAWIKTVLGPLAERKNSQS
jgi:hypothetical protein